MLFTSEQVSAGHPDKICDQISDAIVTDCLHHDRNSRVAVEAMIKDNHVSVAGEITSKHEPDIKALVRHVLFSAEPSICDGFDLTANISTQSRDIALGVDKKGAGDQGMMFGYATRETRKMLPLPFVLATEAIYSLQSAAHPVLLPDAKAQVTLFEQHLVFRVSHSADASEDFPFQIYQSINIGIDFFLHIDNLGNRIFHTVHISCPGHHSIVHDRCGFRCHVLEA